MGLEISRIHTPEERELAAKKDELNALETDLATRETELATLLTELQAFEFLYMRSVGTKMAELDDLEASMADAQARGRPHDRRAKRRAEDAKAQAETSQSAAQGVVSAAEPIVPSPELKLLFREVARNIHPDLSADAGELPRRTDLMSRANQAYRLGDGALLRQILEDWHSAPEAIRGAGVGVDLVRVIRRIAQIERRLELIGEELNTLEYSDLFQLRLEVEEAQADGYDLLGEMAAELDARITTVRRDMERCRVQEAEP